MRSADQPIVTSPDALLVRRAPLGGSPLSLALQRGDDRGWLTARPADRRGWQQHAEAIRGAFAGRDWLGPLAPAFAATGAAQARLAQAAADGLVITTGQQPGLFGGPLYTLSKAIGAIALADALQDALQLPVAPVFWAATDDADWHEASVARFATGKGVVTATLGGPATEGVAMADVPLGDLSAIWPVLDSASGSAADLRVRQVLESAYQPTATIGHAYLVLLRELLEPFGMAVLDAAHPAVREAADPALREALRHAGAIERALVTRSDAIVAAGFTPQVEHIERLSLVFHRQRDPHGVEVRERIPIEDASMRADGALRGSLGPNVLLRPVIERSLLPTACYLAGPGELAYFAQVSAVAEAMGVAAPIAAPRFACELIEAHHVARLAEIGLAEDDLRIPHQAEQHVARRHVSEQMNDALERLRVTMDAQLRAIGDANDGEAVLAPEVIGGLARDLEHRIGRFERRLLAGIKRRESQTMQEVTVLRAAIRPEGHSPERHLNPMPLLARHGVGVLDRMRDEAMAYANALVQGSASIR
jgi:uncharacterized protein YllA (UPF0747 family)